MPTKSGRETAAEKRERKNREQWDAIDAAVALLPEGWAAGEASGLLADDAALRDAGEPWYRSAKRFYASEVEAVAVSRAVKAATGAPYVGFSMVLELASGKAPYYRVEAPLSMPPVDK